MNESARSRTPRSFVLVVLVLALVLGGYIGVLDAGFVWDDRVVALDSGHAEHARTVVDALTKPFWQETAISETTAPYFRPLSSASFVLDQRLHGANPAGFHLTNLALHLLACGLLFAVARRFGVRPLPSALATLFFGVSPRLAECVSWISGRTDVLALVFAFGGVLAWPSVAASSRLVLRRVLAAALFACAFGAKEVAVVVPIALAFAEPGLAANDRARRFAPLAIGVALAMMARTLVLMGYPSPPVPFSFADRSRASLEAVGRYAGMLVMPWRPQLQIGLIGVPSYPWIAAGALVLLAAVVFAFKLSPKLVPAERFGLVLAALAILLVLPLGPVRISVVAADRFLYLPIAGLVIALGAASARFSTNAQKTMALAGGIVSVASVAALVRVNSLWADELALWIEACSTAVPENSLPFTSLGNVLYRGRAYKEALDVYNFTVSKTGGQTRDMALQNVANALGKLGAYDEAQTIRRSLAEARPNARRLEHDLSLSDLQHFAFSSAQKHVGASESMQAPAFATATLTESIAKARDLADLVEADRNAPPPEPPTDLPLVHRAELETAVDRRPEAMKAWVAVLQSPIATPAHRSEAAVLLVRDADVPIARATVDWLRVHQPDDANLPALEEAARAREAFVADLEQYSGELARLSIAPSLATE